MQTDFLQWFRICPWSLVSVTLYKICTIFQFWCSILRMILCCVFFILETSVTEQLQHLDVCCWGINPQCIGKAVQNKPRNPKWYSEGKGFNQKSLVPPVHIDTKVLKGFWIFKLRRLGGQQKNHQIYLKFWLTIFLAIN